MKKPRSEQTPFPQNVPLSKPIPVIDDAMRTAIGTSAAMLIDVNQGNRWAIDRNLDIWNAIIEMRGEPTALPWEGAAHITTPTVFSAYNEFCSRVIGSCLLPRPYTLRGNDPISAQYASASEQFYNDEWDKHDCFDAYERAIRIAGRDGTVLMEVLYDLSTHEEVRESNEPVLDNEGQGSTRPDGSPITKKVKKLVKIVDYDAPREEPIDLKSFYFLPNFAKGVNKADGVAVKVWMNEHDMNAKVDAGLFDADTVEQVLNSVSTGSGEQGMDPQGNSQYTVNNRISIVDNAIAPPDGMVMSRGPIEVYRVHTNLFDLDGDGVPEENILWVAFNLRRLLGFAPYDYFGGRPFFYLAPIPRPDSPYGFSIPEIGRSIQEEVDTQKNARLNILDLAANRQRYRTANVRYRSGDGKWDPSVEVEVTSKNDFGFVAPPSVPQESKIEEEKLTALLDRAVGSPQAPSGAQPMGGTNQRSARAAAGEAQMRALQTNLVNTRVRRWMLQIFKFKHGLYQRYGLDQIETVQQTQNGPKRYALPKEVLGLDYTLGIAGLGGPLDKEQRRNDLAMLTQLLLGTPMNVLFQGRMDRLWNLARLNIETYDIPDVTSFIGTLDESMAAMKQQQEGQQANAQMQALLQVLSHQSSKGGAHVPGIAGA